MEVWMNEGMEEYTFIQFVF